MNNITNMSSIDVGKKQIRLKIVSRCLRYKCSFTLFAQSAQITVQREKPHSKLARA